MRSKLNMTLGSSNSNAQRKLVAKRLLLSTATALLITTTASAQNVLINGDFEQASGMSNGNNIGVSVPGWTFGSGQKPNIVKVDGPGGYNMGNAGPESDASAPGTGVDQHYLDIANGSNSFYQKFVPACDGKVKFGGAFSNRAGGFARGSITIRNGDGLNGPIIGQTNQVTISTSQTQTAPWKSADFVTNLQAGQTYSFVVRMDNNANFDNGYVTYETDCGGSSSGDDYGILKPLLPVLKKDCIPCFGQSINVTLQGKADAFATGGSEVTTPRADFNSITHIQNYQSSHNRAGVSRNYDEGHHNEYFVETIDVANAAQVQKGWIVLKTRDKGGLVTTDHIQLGDVAGWMTQTQNNGSSADKVYARLFSKKYTDFRDDVTVYGDPVWNYDSASGIIYANLEDVDLISKTHSGTSNLLQQLKSDGFVDVVIQDDTEIDFVAIVACVPREGGKTSVSPAEMRTMVPMPGGIGGMRPREGTRYRPGQRR